MTLMKFKPSTSSIPAFESLIDHFFTRDLMPGFENEFLNGFPAVNVSESKDRYHVEIAAPGMKKEDFKIRLEKDVLTIKTEKTMEEKKEEKKYSRRQFGSYRFERNFTLPETADSERIEAEYKDGILHISIPKKEDAREKTLREIDIR